MKRGEAFPSTFVSKDDVQTPKVVTISGVENQMIKGEHGEERKPVMSFSDFDKAMILNGINWQTCEDAYGDDSDGWAGKKIELYHDPNVMFGAKRVGGVRMRLPVRGAATGGAGNNGHWPWAEAVRKAGEVGMTETDLKAYLKEQGLTGYTAARDTATVRNMIVERQKESAFSGEASFEDDPSSIPF